MPRWTIWSRAARGPTCSTALRKAADVVLSDDVAAERGGHGGGVPAPARAARHRGRPGAAGRDRPRPRRQALRRRQRLQVGHGLPRLHLHGRAAARRRDVPPLGQPRHARATSGCSRWPAWPPRPTSCSTSSTSGPDGEVELVLSAERHEGNWLPIAENATDAGRAALLLRLGHRGGLVAVHRAHRRGKPASRPGAPAGGPSGGRRPASWSRWVTSSSPTSSSSCSSPGPTPPTPSCRRSTGPPWARRRRTDPSSARGELGPGRGADRRGRRRPRACTGASRWGTRGGRPSTTRVTRAA